MACPAAILSAISLVILLGAMLLAGTNALLMLRSKSATATYVDSVSRIGGNHGGTFLYPRFAFRPGPARPLQNVVSKAGSTSDDDLTKKTVRVYYDPAHPERATLATFWDMWIGPTVLAAVGLLLLCISVPMLIVARQVPQPVPYS